MDEFYWLLAVLFIDTLIGAVGVVTLFLQNEKRLRLLSFVLMAFSAGTLLGGAFLHLIPEASEQLDVFLLSGIALFGFVVFAVIEAYLHSHRCEDCNMHPYSYLILVGDALHNFIDGLILAATFLVSVPLGIATSIIVISHEIPQELGIFGVQVYGGVGKFKALLYSIASQATVIIGGVLGFMYFTSIEPIAPYVLPFAAGGFIYIAASDLIPELHKEDGFKRIFGLFIFIIGILFMLGIKLNSG